MVADRRLREIVQHRVSGLLFTNGDEPGLTRHLESVAGCEVFPSHVLPAAVVARTRAAHTMELHVDRLRRIFREIAATRNAPPRSRPG